MIRVEYSANNSGGGWWLTDENWKDLEKNGWFVVWATKSFVYNEEGDHKFDENDMPVLEEKQGSFVHDGRYLGAIAKYAYKKFNTIKEALEEFEKITGQNVSDEGCNCCGAPHCFHWEDLETKEREYCSGESCLQYMYDNVPNNLRDTCS